MSRSAASSKEAARKHQQAMNRVSRLRVKVANKEATMLNNEKKQDHLAAVRDEKTKLDQRLEEMAGRKERDLESKRQAHTKIVEASAGHTEAAVQAVRQRNSNLGEGGRHRRAEADDITKNQREMTIQRNSEQANWVRESTRQGISQSQEMRRKQVNDGAILLKQTSDVNSEKALKQREDYKAHKAKKVEDVKASHDAASRAAAVVKARNDVLGQAERDRTRAEEDHIKTRSEFHLSCNAEMHDHVKNQAALATEKQMQCVEEKRRQAEHHRGTLASTLEAKAAAKEAEQAKIQQKTASRRELQEQQTKAAKDRLAAQKRQTVKQDLERQSQRTGASLQLYQQSEDQVRAEEEYLLAQLEQMG